MNFKLSLHAIKRMADRGITAADITNAIIYGKEFIKKDFIKFVVTNRQAKVIKMLKKICGLTVIVSLSNEIITVFRR
jgi:hypothetical protein